MYTLNELSSTKMNTFTISVPVGAESAFLRKMSRNMGWKITVSKPKKNVDPTLMSRDEFSAKIQKAKEQVKNGEMGSSFDSAADLIEYIKSL